MIPKLHNQRPESITEVCALTYKEKTHQIKLCIKQVSIICVNADTGKIELQSCHLVTGQMLRVFEFSEPVSEKSSHLGQICQKRQPEKKHELLSKCKVSQTALSTDSKHS